jgi:hypothetical protein
MAHTLYGHYGKTSQFVRGLSFVYPFIRWTGTVVSRVPRLLVNAATAKKKSGKTMAARYLSAFIAPAAGMWLWNNLVKGDDEDRLSEWDRGNPHLNLCWHTPWGATMSIRSPNLLSEFLSYFGMNKALQRIQDASADRATAPSLGELLKEVGAGSVNRLVVQPVAGYFKMPVELMTGLSFFPNAFNPHRQEPMEAVAGNLGVRREFQQLRHIFGRGYAARPFGQFLLGLGVKATEVRESAFSDVSDELSRYMKKIGKPQEGIYPISQFKQLRLAAVYNDLETFKEARAEWLEENPTKGYRAFREYMTTLDSVSARLNEREVLDFEDSLPQKMKTKLAIYRDWTAELRQRMWVYWRIASLEDSPEIRGRLIEEQDAEIVSKALALGTEIHSPIPRSDEFRRQAISEGKTVAEKEAESRNARLKKKNEARNWFIQRRESLSTAEVKDALDRAFRAGKISRNEMTRALQSLSRL